MTRTSEPEPPAGRAKAFGSRKTAIVLAIAGFVIVVSLAVLALFDYKYPWLLFTLGLLGLLTAVIGAYVFLSRTAPRLDTPLQVSQLERFKRLQGLFRSIPLEERESPANRSATREFMELVDDLQRMINKEGTAFESPVAASNLVHNLHLLYLQIAPVGLLNLSILALRQEFKDTAGSIAFETYSAAPFRKQQESVSDPETLSRILRADATFLANETRRQFLLKCHVETVRTGLVKNAFRSWWWNAVPLIAILIVYLFCQDAVDQALNNPAVVTVPAPAS